jgi:hypothetical protein
MSDQTNTPDAAEPTAIVRPDGTSYTEEKFSLAKTSEIADRFKGEHTISYHLPVAVPNDVEATLANIRAFVSPEADFATVLVEKFNGQGLRLDVQKRIKDLLSVKAGDSASLESAQEAALAFRLGQPRARRESAKREGRVAQAEAKVKATVSTALEMFKALPRAQQKVFGPQLVATGGISQEELDAALAG